MGAVAVLASGAAVQAGKPVVIAVILLPSSPSGPVAIAHMSLHLLHVVAFVHASVRPSVCAATGTALGAAMKVKGGLMHSGYHVQVLAMTGNLAAAGIEGDYRMLTSYFRW